MRGCSLCGCAPASSAARAGGSSAEHSMAAYSAHSSALRALRCAPRCAPPSPSAAGGWLLAAQLPEELGSMAAPPRGSAPCSESCLLCKAQHTSGSARRAMHVPPADATSFAGNAALPEPYSRRLYLPSLCVLAVPSEFSSPGVLSSRTKGVRFVADMLVFTPEGKRNSLLLHVIPAHLSHQMKGAHTCTLSYQPPLSDVAVLLSQTV